MDGVAATKRIDAGIKRGPRKALGLRRSVPRRRDEGTGQVQAIPPNLDPQEVLQRYLTEETTSHIAQSYGLSRKSMVAWLRETVPVEWKRVQIIRAHDRKEQGNEGIDDAQDALSLARARETVKSAQWELTSLDPEYQPKQQVTVTNVIQIDSVLDGQVDKLLERLGVSNTPIAAPLQPIIDITPGKQSS